MSGQQHEPDVREDHGASASDLQARAAADRQDWFADQVSVPAKPTPANGGNPIR
ncbi:hypothetical protein ACFY0G_17485 [Streptomyces sp. NPDC001552]|uniref:hypothetical protein n=1 Tax=Streptomyces sp. NPDC001552 TaxID=3364587 RepID=UPI0036B232B6